MIDLIYLMLWALSLNNMKMKGLNSFFDDYIDLENTLPVKGIFVWMIFFRHWSGYIKKRGFGKLISRGIDAGLKQNIVSLFLFYSGFGINQSFRAKGSIYIKKLPKKSALIYTKSQIIILFFLLNNKILGIKTSFASYKSALIFKKGIGNSYWFAFEIIMLYIYSFLSFIYINKKYNLIGIIILNIICYFHFLYVYNYYHIKE